MLHTGMVKRKSQENNYFFFRAEKKMCFGKTLHLQGLKFYITTKAYHQRNVGLDTYLKLT